MFPAQLMLWLVMFPLAILSFFVVTTVKAFVFLFNCPVDIWTIIGKSLEQAKQQEKDNN